MCVRACERERMKKETNFEKKTLGAFNLRLSNMGENKEREKYGKFAPYPPKKGKFEIL
jgi:hypothetical protein